jgi:hypothetical protein
MTTGTKGSMGDGHNYEYHSWSGSDGKYEIVNGIKRVKFNDFHSYKAMQSASPYAWIFRGTSYPSWPSWTYGSNFGFNLNDMVKIQSKLSSKVRGTSLHLGKNVAEGKQFISMVRDTLFSVAKVIVVLKEGNVQSALGTLISAHKRGGSYLHYEVVQLLRRHQFHATDVAGRWLELQYGWIPLLKDVQAASELFKAQMEGERKMTVRCSSSRTKKWEASSFGTHYTCGGLATFVYKITYEFAENETVSLQRQLGLEDPAGIVWEVVPFSFVVDWFIPIGSYLDSLNILPLLKGRWCLTKVQSAHAGPAHALKPDMYDMSGLSLNGTTIEVWRTHGEGFTFFNIAPPDIRPLSEVFSPMHIYNAVALATQWISGGGFSRK